MSYYGDEEVTYIGIFKDMGGYIYTDIQSFSNSTIGGTGATQYYCSLKVNKGDILYFVDVVNYPQGGYFKAKINYTFSSSPRPAYEDAEKGLISHLSTCINKDSWESMFFSYLGDDFTLSQLTDEPPTEEAPTELTTSGELLETSYDFSGLTLNVSDEIIGQSISGFPTFLVSIVPLGLAAFFACFGIKKALSYFRTIGRGGH